MESNSIPPTQNGQRKRIFFIITQNEPGGAQQFISTLIKNLDLAKFEPVLAYGNTSSNNFFADLINAVQTIELKNIKRNPDLSSDIKTVFEIRKLIKNLEPNVIFLNSSKAGFIGSLANVFPIKLRTANHELRTIYRIGGWSFNDPRPKWQKLLFMLAEKISAGWKDVIIVNSQNDFNQAVRLGIKPRDQIVLIHNGIDVYKINYLPREEARLQMFEKIAKYSGKIFQAKTIIGTIANFYPAKDIFNLIEAAEYFKSENSIVFIVIGEGSERKSIETAIKERGLEHKVLLLGRLQEARKYLTAFDIFVLPSAKEGFPWVLLEAMSAKLPVIATNVGAVSEIIENGKNGFIVEIKKPEQIAGKIKTIINDEHLKQELGIQAHQTIMFKFTLDKMMKEIQNLL